MLVCHSNIFTHLFLVPADTSVELSDEERIELCEELRDLLKERDILLDNEDNSTDDKIRSYWRLSEVRIFWTTQTAILKYTVDTVSGKVTLQSFIS